MAFPTDIKSNTPARYKFELRSETQTIICDPEPLEWSSGSIEFKRDLENGGVFVSFACDSLTFLGNGAKLLRDLFTASEVNAKCTLHIYYWKSSTRTYIEFPSSFDINFNLYEVVKVGKFTIGIRVKAVNNSVQTKFDSRQDIDIDITKLKTIGGETIRNYIILRKGLYYSATNYGYNAELNKYTGSYGLYHTNGTITFSTIPIDKISSDFSEVQTVPYISNVQLESITPFFHNSFGTPTLTIYYTLFIRVTNIYGGASSPFNIQIIQTRDTGGTVQIVGSATQLGDFGKSAGLKAFADNVEITVEAGNNLVLVIQSPGINSTYMAYCERSEISIIESVSSSSATFTQGMPIYEATERLLQHILDVQFPFYSLFFGRTDVAYNETDEYSTENVARHAHVQTGLMQRGLALFNGSLPDDGGAPLVLNFKNLFKSLKAIWNVGYMFDSSIDGLPRLRIEEYAYFFQNSEVLDLSDRIGVYDIESQVMPELIPVEIKSGFNSFEYLSVNGRDEPNTSNSRTTVMNTATKFENISPYRADTKGILDNLANPIEETGTTDTKGENDIFIVKTVRDNLYEWIPETNDPITIDDDTSVFRDGLLNRYFTPTRMLLRHGNRLKVGLMKQLTSYLTFQKTDKANSLITSGDGHTSLAENADILVSTLDTPLFKPIKHTVECKFTFTDLALLQAYPLKYITFSSSCKGYLLHLKKKNNEDRAEITIIEKY